ncbi:MAG: Mrp/NBP35 family ATP-binding protein [Methanotrichaceae archaeon]|nr:Mrp/NBP35 family ATP-binding protein [Methanotrichaceae archaeon]
MTKQNNDCDSCAQKGSCKDENNGQECTHKVFRMSKIKHKIIIASGKGGVGKSTVSVNLARALQLKGMRVGILDADITGPDIPKLLGIEEAKLMQGPEGIEPAKADGIKAASMALILTSRDSPVVWRGPMKMAAIKQFIQDVNWGDLDFLLIDLPPGTSDEPLSVVQLIPELAGAIIVTTPQEVALLDSRKAVNMIRAMKLPVLGIVENMSGLVCPHCGDGISIFGAGGGQRMAEEMDVTFLGSIPIDPSVCALGDSGLTFVQSETLAGGSFNKIVERLLQMFN